MRTEGYDENVDKEIRRSLYCKRCDIMDLNVDARLTDMMTVEYRCFCRHCGSKGAAVYSFDVPAGDRPAALESNSVGILPLDVAKVVEP